MKSRSRGTGNVNHRVTLEFDSRLGSIGAETSVKFQSDRTVLNTNLTVSTLVEILRLDVLCDTESEPTPM